jgi:hypothetical protein
VTPQGVVFFASVPGSRWHTCRAKKEFRWLALEKPVTIHGV